MAGTVADVGEFGLIERIREQVPDSAGVGVGIGDDAAVIDWSGPVVAGVDTMVEGVTKPEWVSGEDIGHRAAGAAMADVAAMGLGHAPCWPR